MPQSHSFWNSLQQGGLKGSFPQLQLLICLSLYGVKRKCSNISSGSTTVAKSNGKELGGMSMQELSM